MPAGGALLGHVHQADQADDMCTCRVTGRVSASPSMMRQAWNAAWPAHQALCPPSAAPLPWWRRSGQGCLSIQDTAIACWELTPAACRFHPGEVTSKAKLHVSVGHSTVMAEATFFGEPDGQGSLTSRMANASLQACSLPGWLVQSHIIAAAGQAQQAERDLRGGVLQGAPAFNFEQDYVYQEQLHDLRGRPAKQPGGLADEAGGPHRGRQWALLSFQQPITAPQAWPANAVSNVACMIKQPATCQAPMPAVWAALPVSILWKGACLWGLPVGLTRPGLAAVHARELTCAGCAQDALVVGSRLDADASAQLCRLAMAGRLVAHIDLSNPQQLARLRLFKA